MRVVLTTVIILLLLSSHVVEAETDVNERLVTKVKAAFVHNFLKFVFWPKPEDSSRKNGTKGDRPDTLNVLVVGDLALSDYLKEYAGDAKDPRTTIRIRFATTIDTNDCFDAIFLGSDDCAGQSTTLLDNLQDKAVLTIGDCDGFLSAGGIIELFILESRVRFNINKTAAEREGLTVSSRLLKLAEVVE